MFRVFLALLLVTMAAAWPKLVPIATPPIATLHFPDTGATVKLGDYLAGNDRPNDDPLAK